MAKKRTERAYRFFYPIFNTYLRLKFRYRYERFPKLAGPCLILANHTMDLDPLLLAAAAGRDLRFVASEHIMRKGFGTWFLQRYFAPIVHTKGKMGLKTSMDILRAIRRGESVALFPEGNRSFNGNTGEIPAVTGKLAKSTGVPLITYRFEGGYLTQPRWSVSTRKGMVRGRFVHLYMPEELNSMTDEEITETIRRDLDENAYRTNEKLRIAYRGKALARGIEAAVFSCPACGAFGTLNSKGNKVFCLCGFSAKYNEYGVLEGSDGKLHTVAEWDALQKEQLRAYMEQSAPDTPLFSDLLRCERIGRAHDVADTASSTLVARKDGAVFGGRFIPLKEIRGLAVHSRNTLTVHIGENETQYELHGEESFSALKYLYLYQMLQGKK